MKLDAESGQIREAQTEESHEETQEPPVRQVVEVVDDDRIPDEMETIKKDAQEIEETAEAIAEEVKEELDKKQARDEEPVSMEQGDEDTVVSESKGGVESLFTQSTSPVTPEITVVGKKDKSLGVWIGAVLGVALAIGLSLIFFVRGPSSLPFLAAKPTPTPTQAPKPTPTTAPAVTRSDITVQVVNGGGTPGAASKMKKFLEDKGYKVAGTSNADEYTFTETEVDVKSGKDAVATLLKDDLKSDYTVASTTGTVEESASYDAKVIVGK